MRSLTRGAVGVALAASLLLPHGSGASSTPSGSTSPQAFINSAKKFPPPPTLGGGQVVESTYRFEYTLPCRDGEPFEGGGEYGCTLRIECGENGYIYHVTRVTIATGHRESLGRQCLQPLEAGPTEADVRREFERTPVPDSKLLLQPPDGVTLVNFRTIFRTEVRPFTREFSLLGFQVELEVTPTVFRWVHGDGTEQSSDWSGREYSKLVEVSSKNYIVHEYATKGVVAPRVDTVWSARFRVDGGAWLPVNGTVTRRGTPVDLRVAEAVPMLVADDG